VPCLFIAVCIISRFNIITASYSNIIFVLSFTLMLRLVTELTIFNASKLLVAISNNALYHCIMVTIVNSYYHGNTNCNNDKRECADIECNFLGSGAIYLTYFFSVTDALLRDSFVLVAHHHLSTAIAIYSLVIILPTLLLCFRVFLSWRSCSGCPSYFLFLFSRRRVRLLFPSLYFIMATRSRPFHISMKVRINLKYVVRSVGR